MTEPHWLLRRPLPSVSDWLAFAAGMLVAALVLLAWAAVQP